MQVLVTGGTGFVGSHAVAAVLAAGHRVRLLARRPESAAPTLAALGVDAATVGTAVEVVAGDATDADRVRQAVQGCDAVLHAAAVYSFDSRDHRRIRAVNEAATRVVLGAGVAAGADPVIHVSSLAALLPSRALLRQDSPVGRSRQAYLGSKAASERVARQYQAAGAPVLISYPPSLLGPHDPHLGDGTLRLRNVARGLMPVWPTGGLEVGDVRDLAAQLAAELRPGLGPRRRFGPSRYLSTAEYVDVVRRVTGRPVPALRLPARAMLPFAALTGVVQPVLPFHLPAEYGAVLVCACAARVHPDARPAVARPVESTVAETLRWLSDRGQLRADQIGVLAAGGSRPATPRKVTPRKVT